MSGFFPAGNVFVFHLAGGDHLAQGFDHRGLGPAGGDGAGLRVDALGVFPTLEEIWPPFGIVGAVVAQVTAAYAAAQKAGQPVGIGRDFPTAKGAVLGFQPVLYSLENGRDGRARLMGAGERDSVPNHLPQVEAVFQYAFHRTAVEPVAGLGAKAKAVQLAGHAGEIQAVVILPENTLCHGVLRFVDGVGFPAAGRVVAQTGAQLVALAQGLFLHTAQDLAGEVDGIVFVEPLDDHLDQAAEHALHDGLGHADDLHAAFLAQDSFVKRALLLVAGKTGKFPQIEAAEGGRLLAFGNGDHALKFRAVLRFAAADAFFLDEYEFRRDGDAVGFGAL